MDNNSAPAAQSLDPTSGVETRTDADAATLIARLEAATEGSRELDAALWMLDPPTEFFGSKVERMHRGADGESITIDTANGFRHFRAAYPSRMTTSIDAAVALVPAVLRDVLMIQFGAPAKAGFVREGRFTYFEGATPALAVCIAALRAREHQPPAPGMHHAPAMQRSGAERSQ